MKPKTFGQVFAQAGPLLAVVFYLGMSVVDTGPHHNKGERLLFMSLLFGVIMGLVVAFQLQGETIVKESDDPKKALQMLAVRLAENRFNLETQTESLHTFKPHFGGLLGVRVYILSEGPTLRIVGPKSVLTKLRDV